jgi:hypothetical protein
MEAARERSRGDGGARAAFLLASVISLVMRYRRSKGEERQQIKWIAFAASFVGLLYLIAMICAFIFPSGP